MLPIIIIMVDLITATSFLVLCHPMHADIDECIVGLNNCDDSATCINTIGSFTCMCNIGFDGDGVSCNLLPGMPM